MAEANNLKLVISADTSDAEKKLKDVGNTKVPAVKVDVVADEVKVDAPKVAPVKVPVEQPKPVKVPVEPPKPVKVPVEPPKTVTVDAKVKPDPVTPKVKQPPPVTIQTKFDETGVGRFVKTLHGVREIAGRVMSALGLIGFVTGLVMAAVSAFQALKSKIEEVTTRAARLAFALEMKSAATETDRLCSSHERLAKVLKDELDTLSKQKAVRAIKETGEQDLEDGRRAADRARQIYEAKTPEEEQALRDKFAVEDEQIARSRRQKTRETQIKDLDNEDSSYTVKANRLRESNAEIDKQLEYERLNVKRAANPRIRRGEGEEEASEEEKAAKARVKALEETKKANDAQIAEWEREAKFRRDQIAALQGVKDYDGESAASLSAKQREKERARENDKATTEADSDWKERRERERKKKDIDEAVEYQKNPDNKRAILNAQADNAQSEADALRKQYEEEMKKSAATRDAAKLADLRAKIDERESTADSYRDQSKKITVDENTKRADALESFAQRADAIDGVSQNRLTAMGLGSGVTAKGTVQSDVRRLVDLLRQNVEATKNIKLGDLPDATYGE